MEKTAALLADYTQQRSVVEVHLLGTAAVLRWTERAAWTASCQWLQAVESAARRWTEEDLLVRGVRVANLIPVELEKIKAADEAARQLLKAKRPIAVRIKEEKRKEEK